MTRKSAYLPATALTSLGLAGLLTGCNSMDVALNPSVQAQALPTDTTPPPVSTATVSPTNTPTLIPTATPWPTPTAWPTPQSWHPAIQPLPTLAPVPAVPPIPTGSIPVNYSPPDGVDVFGSTVLRWTHYGQLAPDEFFDIKIKPFGSNDSAFVEWSKSPEYTLRPWNGWQPGLYIWQIGIVKGYLENGTKHFLADTGRDSQAFLIKWQAAGGGGGGGSSNTGGGGSSSGGGGGGTSGGS
jgi:uncharacterized membrane protein YgcG